jgi:multidrug resistance efflux pump
MGRVDNAATLPKLRADLIFSRPDTADAKVIVKDPVSGEFFRLGAAELFIARQLDGATELEEVRRRVSDRFGAPLTAATLSAFVQSLDHRRLLERPGHHARRPKRIRGTLLHLRVPLLNPTRLLDRLERHTRWCYTRRFLIASAAVILLALATLWSNWDAFAADLPRLYQLSSLPIIVVVMLLLVAAHEFGHGLTCRHFGGDVREMGFLLIYFMPALYCNVSDAWLFAEKGKRMWVGFAGPYLELFLWALAVLIWRVTDPATVPNHLALIVTAGSGIKTLFNFNPLMKLDGYYLLSDHLDLPNLRRKSFRYVGEVLKTVTGWADAPSPVPARERRIFLTYGVLATVYSFSLLFFMTLQFGDLLIQHGQPVALAVLTGLVGVRVRRRVRGIIGVDTPDEDDDGDGEAEGERQRRHRHRTHTEEPSRFSKRVRQLRRRYAWIGGMVFVLVALCVIPVQLRISGPVSVLPSENADVRAAVEGFVDTVVVAEGDRVRAGDVIARLSSGSTVTELRTIQAEIVEAEALLSKVRAGPTQAEIDLAKAAVNRAEDRVEYTRTKLARFRQLYELSAATRPELEDANEQATTAQNDLVEAKSRLNVLLASVRPEEIEAARARLARLQSRRRFLEEQTASLTVVSPVDGIVATPARQLRAMERQLVTKGALIAKVYDFHTVSAQISVPEKEMADVRVGQPVELRARAYPSHTFHGTVTAIGTAAAGMPTGDAATSAAVSQPGSGMTFIVTTRVNNDALLLKPGMTGHAKVFAGKRRIMGIIGRRIARTLKVEVWSWW